MKRSLPLAVVIFTSVAFVPMAHSGFTLHGLGVTQSDRGDLGARTHNDVEGRGAFRHSNAALEARQKRFEGAELVVDLAYRSVTERGSGAARVIDGFADDVPFSLGISMILPQGWQLYRDKELHGRHIPKNISFLGGKAWPEVLAELGDRYALQFHVDWYDRVVMMKPGRAGLLANAERIRVIEEPLPEPVEEKALSEEVVEDVGEKELVENNISEVAAEVFPQPEPYVAPEPVVHTMLVLQGTLFENVVRLSELNGWNPPQWDIEADYRIQADYTINAETFHEAMAKLLLLHPIEADVNLSQRKIYVTREVR